MPTGAAGATPPPVLEKSPIVETQLLSLSQRLSDLESKHNLINSLAEKIYSGDVKIFKWVLAIFPVLAVVFGLIIGAGTYFSYSQNVDKINEKASLADSKIQNTIEFIGKSLDFNQKNIDIAIAKITSTTLEAQKKSDEADEKVRLTIDEDKKQINDLTSKITVAAQDAVSNASKAIELLHTASTIHKVTVTPLGAGAKIVFTPSFDVHDISYQNNLVRVSLQTRVLINIESEGTGRLIGMFIRYDDRFVDAIKMAYPSIDITYLGLLNSGYTVPSSDSGSFVAVRPGAPVQFLWTESAQSNTCGPLNNIISSLSGTIAGNVTVRPLFDQPVENTGEATFPIELTPISSGVFKCEELKRK